MNVVSTYNTIAVEFDATRVSPWKGVQSFLSTLPKYAHVADIGCGNGKYANVRQDLVWMGSDVSENLASIASKRTKKEVLLADGCKLPFKNGIMDASISIAVLHHLPSHKKRKAFLEELLRITQGPVLFTVWAREQHIKSTWMSVDGGSNDYMIPWNNKAMRFYHLFTKEEVLYLLESVGLPKQCFRVDFELNNWFVTIDQH